MGGGESVLNTNYSLGNIIDQVLASLHETSLMDILLCCVCFTHRKFVNKGKLTWWIFQNPACTLCRFCSRVNLGLESFNLFFFSFCLSVKGPTRTGTEFNNKHKTIPRKCSRKKKQNIPVVRLVATFNIPSQSFIPKNRITYSSFSIGPCSDTIELSPSKVL